uniref:Cytoplasmic polyadenylation element-binding protein 3 n=1 Tax=Hydra vulgaris TaxID=6087 RepID=T2M8Q1_HYDVU
MGDYGCTSTGSNTFEPFDTDIYKDKTIKSQELNESKDSDEGFSSSFSPTSESSNIQEQGISANMHLWGSSSNEKEEPYFLGHMQQSVSGNMSYQNVNNRRPIQAPLGHVRKPTPALSTYLASNKAVANSLGVSGWTVQPPQNVSSWPSSQHQSSLIGSTLANSNWNNSIRNGMVNAFSMQGNSVSMHQQQHQQQSVKSVSHNKLNPMPQSLQNNQFYQAQAQQAMLAASIQAKNFKNRNFESSLSFNATPGLNTMQNSISNMNSALDMNIVDDISKLTNSFTNMNTSDSNNINGSPANGFYSNNQERRNEDIVKYSSLESRFLGDVFKSPLDNDMIRYDAFMQYASNQKKFSRSRDDQIVPSLASSLNGSPRSDLDCGIERFSRKVFVGGLPPDIDEDEIHASFCRFGPLTVDWPHKAESKSYFPPKGYAFLLYKDEISVQRLIDCCIMQDGKLYLCVSSPTIKDKPVQIRPWNLADADFVMDGSQPLDPRKTIFVGGVPRPLRAVELAMIMDRLYGGVCYSGIDVDPDLKYPKGAGRVAFSNQQSYIAAISARFIQLQHGEIDKRVEVKPYVLDDQMCDECHGVRCNGKFAPFFCSNITCLQYYCEQCWAIIHSRPGREFHKPLVKEGGDRPRQSTLGFRWPIKTSQMASIPLLQ